MPGLLLRCLDIRTVVIVGVEFWCHALPAVRIALFGPVAETAADVEQTILPLELSVVLVRFGPTWFDLSRFRNVID
jgi:hypothetical protein